MSGGGSGGGTSTQIQDVPEWARGYAKKALGTAEQLTDIDKNPYQSYTGERVAQFTPLQQQSYQGAANMQAGPGAFQSQVGQYMSPYMQNVVDVQKREAARQSQMGGLADQAMMTKAGAFGGGRDAIMRAERARNLGTQMGDIQAQGLQSAYTNATNQYNVGQSQNMAINQLQNQFGGQQQQQVQNILGQRYQDFLSQKQYPYQQLEFMSGLMRGTPMGTVSSMYQPPGSMLGQVAGLGMGAYGLSQMGMKFAGGGSVDAPENVASIVDGLSDAQLEQAEQAAKARGDIEQLKAIQSEKAMRASERGGMAGAFNSLPYTRQEQMMAGGGMAVAFKKGGDEGEETYFQDPMGTPSAAQGRKLSVSDFLPDLRQNVNEGESYSPGLRGMLFGYNVKKPEPKKEESKADPYKDIPPTRRADFEDKTKTQISPTVKRGLSELANKTGYSADSLMDQFKTMNSFLKEQSKGDINALKAMVDQSAGDSKEVKEQMLGKALAQYGFQWAANAAKPGARLVGSAAEASPVIAQSVAESQKLERDLKQNQLKLNMTLQQFRIAQNKGDERTALMWAQQARQLEQSQQMLALKQQELGMQGQALGMKQNQFNAMLGAKMASAAAQNKQAQARLAQVGVNASNKYDENNRRTRDELINQHGPMTGEAMYRQRRKDYIREAMQATTDSMSDTQSSGGGGVRNYFDLMGMGE
jgi:hypothetical protein